MENTTKALLIAASVLTAILIISLGIMIFNKSKSSADASETLKGINMQSFNSKYEMLEGNLAGSTVKRILEYAINDNTELFGVSEKTGETIEYCLNIRSNHPDILNTFKTESNMITALNGTRSYGVRYAENILRIKQAVKQRTQYKVWYSYNKETGLIWEIHIDAI